MLGIGGSRLGRNNKYHYRRFSDIQELHVGIGCATLRSLVRFFKSTLTDLGLELTGFKYQTIASSSLAAHFMASLGDISPIVTLATIAGMMYRLYISAPISGGAGHPPTINCSSPLGI